MMAMTWVQPKQSSYHFPACCATSVLIILLAPFSVVSNMISPSRSREVAPSINIPLLAWMQSSEFWIRWSPFCHWFVIKTFVHGMVNGDRIKLVSVTTACQWAKYDHIIIVSRGVSVAVLLHSQSHQSPVTTLQSPLASHHFAIHQSPFALSPLTILSHQSAYPSPSPPHSPHSPYSQCNQPLQNLTSSTNWQL